MKFFDVEDAAAFQAFLQQHERALAYFHGTSCPYARRFRPAFEAKAAQAPVPFAVRELDLFRDDEWDDHGIEVTPTLVLFERGEEVARLEARAGVGLASDQFERWLARLA